MFRSTGRPKTAINVICNVAWASSLGGLCLLAEERRRRLLLAQKIIENGKRLQAYKAYTAAAAVAAFDLGDEWDSNLPNLDVDEGAFRKPVGHTLTNDEWRSRSRVHRAIPTATVPPSPPEHDVPRKVNNFANVALPFARELPSHSVAKIPNSEPTVDQKTAAVFRTRNEAVKNRITNETQSSPNTKNIVAQRNYPQPFKPVRAFKYRLKYALHVEELVARRVTECLHSDNADLRSSGYRELSVFFENFERHPSPLLEKVVKLALDAEEPNAAGNSAFEAREQMKVILKMMSEFKSAPATVSSIAFPTSIDTNVQSSVPSQQGIEVSEAPFAREIRQCLDARQFEDAFYWFLALCDKATTPVTRATRKLIRELTFAYKSLGLYSVVMEIQKQTLHSLKEWRLLYADMAWLMNHAAPQNNATFCWDAVQAFMRFKPMGKDSRVNLSVRFLRWFAENNEPEHGIYLFMKIFRRGCVECEPRDLQDLAQDLYEQAIKAELFEQAHTILSWITEHTFTLTGTLIRYKPLLEKLMRHSQEKHTVDLYISLRDCYEQHDDAVEIRGLLTLSFPAIRESVYRRCDELVPALHQRREYDAVSSLSYFLDDHSKLHPATTALFYSAYSQVGSLVDAKRTVDNLVHASFPLWQDMVHDSHSMLLHRCWKMTRNFPLTEELFLSIRALGFHRARSVQTFNAMILACVEDKRMEAAQQYMTEMVDGARLKPTVETWSYLMLGKALSRDWNGVSNLVKDAQASGVLPSRGGCDGSFFDPVFVEFCRQHNAEEITEFAINLTSPKLLTITEQLSEKVVEAIVKSEDKDLLQSWVSHVYSRGLMPSVGTESVALILNRIMQSKKLKFHPNLSEAHHLHATSEAAGAMQTLDNLNAMNTQQGPGKRSLQQKFKHTEDKSRKSRRSTERAMLNALSREEPLEALHLYGQSLVHGLPRQQVDLELAVRASLEVTPDSTETAHELINDAEAAGLSVERSQTQLLIHEVQRKQTSEDEAHEVAFAFYRKVDEPRVKLHHHITIALVKNLNNNGNPAAGLRLLKAVYESEWGQRKAFDITVMTMCLRLTLEIGHLDGVDWVLKTVMEQNLRIDKIFIDTLRSGLQASLRRRHNLDYFRNDDYDPKSRWTEALAAHIATARARREQQRNTTLDFAKQTVDLLQIKANKF